MSTTYTPNIKSINGMYVEREVFDCTHLASPESTQYPGLILREYTPGVLTTQGQLTLGVFADPDEMGAIPINAAPEQITMTFKKIKIAGVLQATGATLVFDGFVVRHGFDVEFEGLMDGEVVLQPSGDIVITAGTPGP